MTNNKHTPEPWDVRIPIDGMVNCKMGHITECLRLDGYMKGTMEANAYRIVACVNALAGVNDPAAFVQQAKAAPDLLEACHKAQIEIRAFLVDDPTDHGFQKVEAALAAAIAKAGGKEVDE